MRMIEDGVQFGFEVFNKLCNSQLLKRPELSSVVADTTSRHINPMLYFNIHIPWELTFRTSNGLRNHWVLFADCWDSPCICKGSIYGRVERTVKFILLRQVLSTHPPLSRTYHQQQAGFHDPKQQISRT